MTVSSSVPSVNGFPSTQVVTRFAAKQRLGFMGLPAQTAHQLRQLIDRHQARMVRSGDKRHQLRDHHLIDLDELAQSLFTCPEKRETFVSTNWSDWLSSTCREVVAHDSKAQADS